MYMCVCKLYPIIIISHKNIPVATMSLYQPQQIVEAFGLLRGRCSQGSREASTEPQTPAKGGREIWPFGAG